MVMFKSMFCSSSCNLRTRQINVYIYIPMAFLSPFSRRLHDNELSSSANQLRLWLQSELIMRRGGRGARSRSSCSSLCVLSSGCGRPECPALNDARFFYFSTAGAPVRAAEYPVVGVLMAAWTPNATRWRWILAFVSWGISLYRFCPLCWGKKAHRSGSTIGNGRGDVTLVPHRPPLASRPLYCCIIDMNGFVFSFSSSGASVVAIDNKIEQAMVRRCLVLFVT